MQGLCKRENYQHPGSLYYTTCVEAFGRDVCYLSVVTNMQSSSPSSGCENRAECQLQCVNGTARSPGAVALDNASAIRSRDAPCSKVFTGIDELATYYQIPHTLPPPPNLQTLVRTRPGGPCRTSKVHVRGCIRAFGVRGLEGQLISSSSPFE